MSKATGWQTHHDPDGKREIECAWCGVKFRTSRGRAKYCCYKHKEMAGNRRFYERHRKEIILMVMLREARGTKKSARSKTTTQKTDLDAMTPDELLEYVRNNPHQVTAKRRGVG